MYVWYTLDVENRAKAGIFEQKGNSYIVRAQKIGEKTSIMGELSIWFLLSLETEKSCLQYFEQVKFLPEMNVPIPRKKSNC